MFGLFVCFLSQGNLAYNDLETVLLVDQEQADGLFFFLGGGGISAQHTIIFSTFIFFDRISQEARSFMSFLTLGVDLFMIVGV